MSDRQVPLDVRKMLCKHPEYHVTDLCRAPHLMRGTGLGKGLLKQLAMRDRVCRGLGYGPARWTTGAGTMPGLWLPIMDSKMLKAMKQASAR